MSQVTEKSDLQHNRLVSLKVLVFLFFGGKSGGPRIGAFFTILRHDSSTILKTVQNYRELIPLSSHAQSVTSGARFIIKD